MNVYLNVICIALSLSSCAELGYDQQREQWTQLCAEEKHLQCVLDEMKESIHFKWDTLSSLLESNLRADIPQEERTNILAARNAGLIRMFESFAEVPDTVKHALDKAEMFDLSVAQRVTAARDEINGIQADKLVLLTALEADGSTETVRQFREVYDSIMHAPCMN